MLLLLTLISAFLYSSLVEYWIHRFVLHRSNEVEHIKDHHRIFHGIKSYEIKDARPKDILLDAKGIFLNAAFYLLPSSVIFIQNKILGILFFVICFIYNIWEEYVHLYSHKSTNSYFEQLGVFKRLKEHHRVHHYIYNSNYGIGSTIWDLIFRTKKIADKKREERMLKKG